MVSQFRKTPLALFVTSFVGFTASSSLIAHELQEVSSPPHNHANTEVITVTASPMNRTPLESAQPITILAGDELQEQHAHTLGETLAKMPGVNATHFAGVASSPVIRGLDGPRVKITQNGLDSGDVSRGSPDHAVTTETSVAEQIEVFRGPATLLYGSGAIGGVVNVVDNRIAKDFVGGVRGFYGVGGDTASNRREMTAGITADHGQSVWHFDAFTRHSGDYDAPTFINEEGESVTTVENSFIDAQGANLGVSYLFDSGYLGVSYGRMEQQYGIPGHSHHGHDHDHAHDHAHEAAHAEGPYADLWQNRVQVHGGWNNPSAAFKQVELRYGFTDYQHQEIEHGVAGTTFGNRQHELRLTATHEAWQGWTGALGYHFFDQEQTAAGAEAYTPDSTTRKHAAFWLLEKEHQKLNWQLGARVEDVQVNERSFTPVSASFGVTYSMNDAWVLSANIAHAQRAPTAAELYSNGAHLATRTYELGLGYELEAVSDHHYHLHQVDRAGRVEKANNIDLGIHLSQQRFHFDWTFFYNRIDDFVYGAYTSVNHLDLHHEHHHEHDHEHNSDHDHDHAFHEGLPVIAYTQRDVELYGYELNTSYELSEQWTVALFSDYVRAKTRDGGENLPRIPAQRFGSDLRYQAATWETTLSYIWYNKQNRISHGESVTDSFGLLNAQVNWFPTQLASHNLSVYLKAENLTDELGLVHNSFLKEYAPMRGRNLSIGIRGEF